MILAQLMIRTMNVMRRNEDKPGN